MKIRQLIAAGYEQLSACITDTGYHGLIAVHSTHLGPAVGGTRYWQYKNEEEAINDVLRLARGMTYKNALAGIPFGGGKSIILKNDRQHDRHAVFRSHGQFIETFSGRYITAEDVGTTPRDMEIVQLETRHVAGLAGGSGDPSPYTARGVFRAMQAAANFRWGTDSLSERTVALQGCGKVGYHLASYLHSEGANLIVTDVDANKVNRVVQDFNAVPVAPDEIYGYTGSDIFAPCALGGVINDQTIGQLKSEIVVGAANNQLLEPRHGDALSQSNILYAPDYAANAGGVINGCRELLGWDAKRTDEKVDAIYNTVLDILRNAAAGGVPTYKAADSLAEARLRSHL